jgi:hypothetical protein
MHRGRALTRARYNVPAIPSTFTLVTGMRTVLPLVETYKDKESALYMQVWCPVQVSSMLPATRPVVVPCTIYVLHYFDPSAVTVVGAGVGLVPLESPYFSLRPGTHHVKFDLSVSLPTIVERIKRKVPRCAPNLCRVVPPLLERQRCLYKLTTPQ